MDTVRMTIDGQAVEVPVGTTILEAARKSDIYIPSLCYHPDLPPAKDRPAVQAVFHGGCKIENDQPEQPGKGCGICLVEVQGQSDLVGSCATEVADGMVVMTQNECIREKRQENLLPIMLRHPHACLTCAQQEGCRAPPMCRKVSAAARSSGIVSCKMLPVLSASRIQRPDGCPPILRYSKIIPCLKEIIICALVVPVV